MNFYKLKFKNFNVYSKDIEDILAGIQPARCGSTFFRDLGDKGNFDLLNFYLFHLTRVLLRGCCKVCNCMVESQCRKMPCSF